MTTESNSKSSKGFFRNRFENIFFGAFDDAAKGELSNTLGGLFKKLSILIDASLLEFFSPGAIQKEAQDNLSQAKKLIGEIGNGLEANGATLEILDRVTGSLSKSFSYYSALILDNEKVIKNLEEQVSEFGEFDSLDFLEKQDLRSLLVRLTKFRGDQAELQSVLSELASAQSQLPTGLDFVSGQNSNLTPDSLAPAISINFDGLAAALKQPIADAIKQIECCGGILRDATEPGTQSTSTSKTIPTTIRKPSLGTDEVEADTRARQKNNKVIKDGTNATNRSTEQTNKKTDAEAAGADQTQNASDATEQLTGVQEVLGNIAEDLTEKFGGIDDKIKGTLNTAFDKIIEGDLDNIGQVFKDLFKSIESDLKNTLATAVKDDFLGPAVDNVFATLKENLKLTEKDIGGIFAGISAGSLLGDLTGSRKKGPGNEIGGAIGGLIGKKFIPGPLGSFIGSTVGSFLGGLFGSKPSDKTEGVKLNFDTGVRSEFDLGPKKDSPENREAANAFAERMAEFVRKLEEISGGSVSLRGGNDFSIGVGSRDGIDVSFGSNVRRNFKTIEQAWDFSVEHISENLTGIPEEVQVAIKSIDFKGDVDRALGLVDVAVNFENIILALNEGTRNVADTLIGAAQTEAKDVLDFVKQFKADTAELFPGSANTNTQNTPDFFDLGDFGYGIDQQAIIDAYNNYHGITNQVADAVAEVSDETKEAEAATRSYVESLFETKEPVSEIQSAVDQLNERFLAFNDVFEEVGITASEATDLFDTAMNKMRVIFNDDLDALFNEVTGKGYLNGISEIQAQYELLIADATALGLELDKVNSIFGVQLTNTLDALFGSAENADDARSIFEAISVEFAAYPDILTTATEAFVAFIDELAANELRETLIAGWEEEISALEERNRLQETAKNSWEAIAESAKATQLRLLTDPSISRFSAEERASETQRLLEEAFAAAQTGDVDAAGSITELALEAAEANAAFFASSEDFARVNERIEFILKNTESFAQTQVSLLQGILDANIAQIEVLQGQISTANTTPTPSAPVITGSDLDALTQLYGTAFDAAIAGGVTEAEFVAGEQFKGFEDSLITLIGGLKDRGRLLSDYNDLIPTTSDAIYGSSRVNITNAIADRLQELGVSLPSFATGGVTDGLAIIHPGELLYTGPPARVINAGESAGVMARSGDLVTELRSTRRAIESLNGTVSAANDDQMGGLNRMTMRLGSIESGLELRAARA